MYASSVLEIEAPDSRGKRFCFYAFAATLFLKQPVDFLVLLDEDIFKRYLGFKVLW